MRGSRASQGRPPRKSELYAAGCIFLLLCLSELWGVHRSKVDGRLNYELCSDFTIYQLGLNCASTDSDRL